LIKPIVAKIQRLFVELKEKLTQPETFRVCIYFILLVAFGIANSYSGRWNQLKFGNNYAFFNNQVRILNSVGLVHSKILFQFTTFAYAVIAQAVTTYRYYFTKEITDGMMMMSIEMVSILTWSIWYFSDMKAFPWWKFAMFGFFDGACAFLFSIGAPSTPASCKLKGKKSLSSSYKYNT
jgi:hypothetical protein